MEEVAVVDPRSDAERVEVDELEATIVTTLEDQGLEDLARTFETVRMAAALDARMPPELAFLFARLGELPQPVAVFLSTEPGRAPA
jgi:hypothetical protein